MTKINYPTVTTKNVKALNPCSDRFNNFTKHYPNYSGDLMDFLNLEHISYHDKIWVFTRLATHVQNVRWSILCAESCLANFEKAYPDDKRPRQAIEAAQAFALNPSEENRAAVEAARAAAARAAVEATGAAARAAWAAARAAWAAARAAWAAAGAAAEAAEKQQEELNLMFMLEACRE